MRFVLVLFLLVDVLLGATFVVKIGFENSVSFDPTALTIQPNDTVTFTFYRPGDAVISGANTNPVCPGGTLPEPGSCDVAANPIINFTGPLSAQEPTSVNVVFPDLGVFPLVNPTYCRTTPDFATVACSAKTIITVANPVPTPSPGSTIIVIGAGGLPIAFPTPLRVTPGDDVWFRFEVLTGVNQTDSNGNIIPGGLSCPVATKLGSYCKWTVTAEQTYFYRAFPLAFGGVIEAIPNVVIPVGGVVIELGVNGSNSFIVPVGNFTIPFPVYFRFNSYGPYRVQRGDGPSCQRFVGVGSFDSLYQAAGRVFSAQISTNGVTYFLDPSFCVSDGMRGFILGLSGGGGSDFVEVSVAPPSSQTGASQLAFSPTPAIVYQGGSVRWTFFDFGHTVTQSLNNDPSTCQAQPGGFNSGFVQPPVNGLGGTFVQQFNQLGNFSYHCAAHCSFGMIGQVIVVPRPENVITHGVNDTNNPNQFSPPTIVATINLTVCWDFITAGDIVESEFFGDCVPRVGGFNSGFQPVGSRVCRTFTGPACSAFYFFDSANCQNASMYGVVVQQDAPFVTVNNSPQIYSPATLNVAVGTRVVWTFNQAGNSVTQAADVAQFSSPITAVRCAPLAGGFDSGVVTVSGQQFSQNFSSVQTVPYFSLPFCPFPDVFPAFFGVVNVCNPVQSRPTTTTTTQTTGTTTSQPFVTTNSGFTTPPQEPTTPPVTTTPSGPCPPPDPCAPPPTKKTVINLYFADILSGAQCQNCTA